MTDLKRHLNIFDQLDYYTRKIGVIEKTTSWTKVENQKKVYQTFPSFETIIIGQGGIQVLATPIKNNSLSDEHKNMDNIIQQNNFTNIYLKTIGEQLQNLENRFTHSSTTLKKENESKAPLFIPHEIPPHLRAPLKKPTTDNLLNEIAKKQILYRQNHQKIEERIKNLLIQKN